MTVLKPLTRPDLSAIPAYKPGRNPADVANTTGTAHGEPVPMVKLSSNELPFSPSPAVLEAIAQVGANRYPDMTAKALRQALSLELDVHPEQLVTGCGSVALCENLAIATCKPEDEIAFGWRSFEAYPMIASRVGARAIRVPNTDQHRIDLAALASAVTPKTRMVFVCSPNNPTGTTVDAIQLDAFLNTVPEDVLVVLDEAYREFSTDPAAIDGVQVAQNRPNVVVLRTFSKAWGLAGLRVGYAIASVDIARVLRTVTTPFSTNAVGQAAALAALNQPEVLRKNVATIVAERERVTGAIQRLLPNVPTSQGNFVWLPLGSYSDAFCAAAETRGVILRSFDDEGVRVTIGTSTENNAFLSVAEELLTAK